MPKQTIEQRALAELRRIKVAIKAGNGDHDCLYGAQQALEWLLNERVAGAPAKIFRHRLPATTIG